MRALLAWSHGEIDRQTGVRAMRPEHRRQTGGPFFEDLVMGHVFRAPGVTVSAGHVAVHQAIVGNRSAATLDAGIARDVFGGAVPVPPGLVVDFAIGQSSVVTRRVHANLFYRGLQVRRLPVIGDTLRTTIEVVALKQNRRRFDRGATGLAVLRIRTVDQEDRAVLDFERCAMLPLRNQAETRHADDVHSGRPDVDLKALITLANEWDPHPIRQVADGPYADDLRVGDSWEVEDADVVTCATELARLTMNVAAVHHDRQANGAAERLIYGGHTVGLAALQASRALPALTLVVGWHGCDHTAPVFERDELTSTIEVQEITPLNGGGALVHLRSRVRARRGKSRPEVLDWRYIGLIP